MKEDPQIFEEVRIVFILPEVTSLIFSIMSVSDIKFFHGPSIRWNTIFHTLLPIRRRQSLQT